MKIKYWGRLLSSLALILSVLANTQGQNVDPKCNPVTTGNSVASAFLTYGSGINMKSNTRRMKLTVGQPVVGSPRDNKNVSHFGYWGQYLVPPFPPMVTASQGELLDRIQITWVPNPLGPYPVGGFKILRDGVFLALVDSKTRNFNDFNVIAGRPYTYTVRGVNSYGDGSPGNALGFQVPNGVVTGQIATASGNPVPDAMVTLMPMQGFSALFTNTSGAFTSLETNNSFLPTANADWSICFWMKTASAVADAGILELGGFPLYINAQGSSSGHEGISIGNSGGDILSYTFPDSSKNDWHHVTLTYSDEVGRLYVDGVLVDLHQMSAIPAASDLMLGARTHKDGWSGRLDELRFYHRRLDEIDLGEVMEGTASSTTPGLKYYWKMDEEQGTKSFDVLNRNKLYFCGANFDADRPPVRTSGKTDSEGFYRIESASYGTGVTFLAEPEKLFYMHRALKFARSHSDYAALPDFSLTPKSTLEIWVNSAGPDNEQCILSKTWGSNDFRLMVASNGTMNELRFYLNGTVNSLGPLGTGYQHLAFTIDSMGNDRIVTAYKNGVLISTNTFPGVSGDWSDTQNQWIVGARKDGSGNTDFFGGLVDEFAVYDRLLTGAEIDTHFKKERKMNEAGLRLYFPMDEGSGVELSNAGSVLVSYGSVTGATWTPFSPNQKTEKHEFSPHTRQVTLNPSVTSVDQVDYIDRSTITVSGYVRYKNSDCFAANIEILVNGAPYNPKILTDSTGRFVADFDPGTTAKLTPKFEDHMFLPAFWNITNLTSPISGILFSDVTTRKVEGKVTGGDCGLPIIKIVPPGSSGQQTTCKVKLRSLDGCYEHTITIGNEAGIFVFDQVPPISYTVAVIEHSNPEVYQAFEVEGGKTVDVSKQNDTINFTYYAAPNVAILGLDSIAPDCHKIVLESLTPKTITIKVYEHYDPGGDCYVDNADIRVINGIADAVVDMTMHSKTLEYKFDVGLPNPSMPYEKSIQVLARTVKGREASVFKSVIVTGIKQSAATFVTTSPSFPMFVLRDPPGDASYAYLEKDSVVCSSFHVVNDYANGTDLDVTIDNGPDVNIVAAPLGAGTIIQTGTTIGLVNEYHHLTNITSDSSMDVCLSFSQRISTSEDELVVGAQGGDVYVGGAFNVGFGNADKIEFNTATCEPVSTPTTIVQPGQFATTYIYSEWNIKTNLIPNLQRLYETTTDPTQKEDFKKSKERWESIIARNNQYKELAAKGKGKNISFDGLTSYEYSSTIDTSYSTTEDSIGYDEWHVGPTLGFDAAGAGIQTTFTLAHIDNQGHGQGTNNSKGITTGYVLGDNDPGDAISVDIYDDPFYKTPVFKTKFGRTSCPWEPATAHRDGAQIQDATPTSLTNVPANEAAVFKFNLSNVSETKENRIYALKAGPENNPNGAVIKLNGAPLNNTINYNVMDGQTIPITVTVERGPVEYDYDNLEISFSTDCEDTRAEALGINPSADPIAYSSKKISVHFIRPCSEVNITNPNPNWLLTNNPNSIPAIMPITISGYDKSNTLFDKITLQYRKVNGDGAWINIVGPNEITPILPYKQKGGSIERINLGNTFSIFDWKTTGLEDGEYEIRAITICSGTSSGFPGYSQIIQGRIDRDPPKLLGTPQPSDGVLHVGDEISFTFNEAVNCGKIIPASGMDLNNAGLFNASTNDLVGFNVSCYENKITLTATDNNVFLENFLLRAELADIEDIYGNVSSGFEWEFFVDRNELGWLTDSVGISKFQEQTRTVTVPIHNRGGYPASFSIQGVPSWVHVVPDHGTLVPNEIRQISFTADSSLAFGLWSGSVVLHTETGQNSFFMGGDEPLPVGVRVMCHPPGWDMVAGQYENTMNMVLRVNIQGQNSTDVEDIVGAFINGELRGRANVEYVPQLDRYMAYLTVYGDINDNLADVKLQVWDASACILYGTVQENFTFQGDNVIGITTSPQIIHTTSLVLRDVPLGYGWNWLSFNLAFPNNSVNAALTSLNHPEDDLIKSQTQFATYSSGWFGSLNTLGNTGMYIYKADQPDTLQMLGNLIDPATTNIPLVQGWNWIGYVPSYALPINNALSSVPAQTGDLIKSQIAFAQYINSTFGWIGNLKYMEAPNGYQIKLSSPGTLTYPPPAPFTGDPTAERGGPVAVPAHWSVNASQYENTSTLIGMLRVNGANATTATMELGAFVGSEVRGTAQAVYVAPLNAYLFFLTSYANASGELMHFKLYDQSTGAVQNLAETMYFTADNHQGSIESPLPFSLQTTDAQEPQLIQSFDIQPNPFSDETVFRFVLPQSEDILLTITDVSGREVSILKTRARAGVNTVTWDGKSDAGTILHTGVYFVRLETAQGIVTRKVVLQR